MGYMTEEVSISGTSITRAYDGRRLRLTLATADGTDILFASQTYDASIYIFRVIGYI